MPFSSFREFRDYLNVESRRLTGRDASTNTVPKSHRNQAGADETWWRSTGRLDGTSPISLNRNRAYLRTYYEACGNRIPSTGIGFGDGSVVWPDRSVMERSLRDGHLIFDTEHSQFEFTPTGLRFVQRPSEERI